MGPEETGSHALGVRFGKKEIIYGLVELIITFQVLIYRWK
jgi:hypothetical protein